MEKYNCSQTEEATKIIKEINFLVDSCEIKLMNTLGRKGKDKKILAKIILISELMQLTERQTQSWINLIGNSNKKGREFSREIIAKLKIKIRVKVRVGYEPLGKLK